MQLQTNLRKKSLTRLRSFILVGKIKGKIKEIWPSTQTVLFKKFRK